MKYLGIDYWSKRVGVAVSDETGSLAFPHVVLQSGEKLVPEIEKIIKEEKITKIILGESKNFEGESNKIMGEIENFKKELETKLKIEVVFEPEFLTSFQAQQITGKNENTDASAAAIILQSYLDRKKDMI